MSDADLKRLKLEMLSKIAHDVRAPLSVVLTGLKELRGTQPAFDDYQRTLFQLVTSSAETSLQLLKDLHDLARLDMAVLPLQKSDVEIRALLRSIVASLPDVDGAAPVQVQEGEAVSAGVDADRVRQALSTLCDAARRGARTVDVDVDRGTEGARVTITSHGGASTAEDLARAFEPHARKGHWKGATGLGLAVARGLVVAHGGLASIEAAPDGDRFVVVLPSTG